MPRMADVSAGIVPVIPIDRAASIPLHRQIYDGFRTAILRGNLRPGQQVLSSRELAANLQISRFPVLDAYAQLLAEGYFETRVGAGTFISTALPIPCEPIREPKKGKPDIPRQTSRRSSLLPRFKRPPWLQGWGAFAVHQPALDQFPFEIWSNLVSMHSRRPRLHAMHNIDPLGLPDFREAVCTYLRTSRAVHCDPQQIMIVSGSQQALEITARVLLDPDDPVWIEEPSYQLTRAVLLGAGCRLISVPVDQEGLDVATGIRLCENARAAFVTPSHQYPLGATMTAARRLQLLNWAQESGSWIIEDDYDSEYRFESMPIPSLQGLDNNSRVIYIGTFSKVLFPSLRIGYIVIPPDLVEDFVTVRFAMDIFPPYLFQETLTAFMQAGHFAKHIRRTRALYKERRTALVENIQKIFGNALKIHGAEAGMHMTVTYPGELSDVKIAEKAAKENLWLWPLSSCYRENPRNGFILGFGNIDAKQMEQAVLALRASLLLP